MNQLEMDNTLASLAVVTGISLHQLVFRHGEWDTSSPSIVVCHLLLLLVGSTGAHYGMLQGYSPLLIWKIGGYYLLGLYSSMLVYRGFFHRLRQFPGPFLARLSNFYLTRLSAKNLHLYEEVQALHREYGHFVRVGEFSCLRQISQS